MREEMSPMINASSDVLIPSVSKCITLAGHYWPVTVAGAALAYGAMRYVWESFRVDALACRAVFITGADTGFGRMLVLRCAERGMTVFAGCKTQKGREHLQKESSCLRGRIITLELDVTNDESVEKARQCVIGELLPDQFLWALVNNAGIMPTHGPDEWSTIEDYHNVLNVNFYGMVRCTHALLPLLKQSRGRIVNMSSCCGRVSFAGLAPYCVSKYAVEAWTDAIRQELKVFGVKCSMLEPSSYATRLMHIAPFRAFAEASWTRLSPELRDEYGLQYKEKYLNDLRMLDLFCSKAYNQVIDAYYHAITARWPRVRYHCGFLMRVFYAPISFLPASIQDALILVAFRRVPQSITDSARSRKLALLR